MSSDIVIKKLESEIEIKEFIVAWEHVFQRKLEDEVYSWVFSEINNLYACYDGGVLVSGYCLLEINAKINNEIVIGGLCNNVFVNGYKYQKLGMFGKITNFALEDIADRGFKFALGFPNNKAIKAHLRAGWQQESNLPFYEFIGKPVNKIDNSITIKNEDLDGDSFNKICHIMDDANAGYSFLVRRSESFLNWRLKLNPRWNYDIFFISPSDKITGFFVTKYFPDRDRVHIVDYAFSNSMELDASVQRIYEFYTDKGVKVDCIDGWCASGDKALFESSGFQESNDFSYVIFKDLSFSGLQLGTAPHLTLADNDVY